MFVPADAHFAVVSRPAELIALDNFAQGTQEYPDRSATLILELERLGPSGPLILDGPGIRTTARLDAAPLPDRFLAQWNQNLSRYPRGVDVILAGPDAISTSGGVWSTTKSYAASVVCPTAS